MRNERGSTLVFSLIFLLILTVLAVSTMNTAFLDEKMAANVQFKNQAFQSSQSEIQGQYSYFTIDNDPLSEALDGVLSSTTDPSGLDIQVDQGSNIGKEVSLTYVGEGLPPSGFSLNEFTGLRYTVNAKSSIGATGTESDQDQGLNYAAPKQKGKTGSG